MLHMAERTLILYFICVLCFCYSFFFLLFSQLSMAIGKKKMYGDVFFNALCKRVQRGCRYGIIFHSFIAIYNESPLGIVSDLQIQHQTGQQKNKKSLFRQLNDAFSDHLINPSDGTVYWDYIYLAQEHVEQQFFFLFGFFSREKCSDMPHESVAHQQSSISVSIHADYFLNRYLAQ